MEISTGDFQKKKKSSLNLAAAGKVKDELENNLI